MRLELALAAKIALTTMLVAPLNRPPPAAHDDTPVTPAIGRANKLIDDEKAIIGRFMHPTGALDKIVCTKTKEYGTGEFYCVYAFHFDGGKYTSSLRFSFFEDGSLAAIDIAGTTTWIKPFQAVDLVIAAVVHVVPQVGRSVTAALKDEPAKMLLEFWLRSRQAARSLPVIAGPQAAFVPPCEPWLPIAARMWPLAWWRSCPDSALPPRSASGIWRRYGANASSRGAP
jgi:hypothetical protein